MSSMCRSRARTSTTRAPSRMACSNRPPRRTRAHRSLRSSSFADGQIPPPPNPEGASCLTSRCPRSFLRLPHQRCPRNLLPGVAGLEGVSWWVAHLLSLRLGGCELEQPVLAPADLALQLSGVEIEVGLPEYILGLRRHLP